MQIAMRRILRGCGIFRASRHEAFQESNINGSNIKPRTGMAVLSGKKSPSRPHLEALHMDKGARDAPHEVVLNFSGNFFQYRWFSRNRSEQPAWFE